MGLLFFISAQDVVVIPPDPGGEVVVVSISSVYDVDPYLDQIVLLMHGDSLVDECGKSITVNGNVAVSSEKKKFGTGSLYFDGSGDYLSIPSSTDFVFGTGDFTFECWVNSTVINAGNGIFRITDTYLKQDQTGIGLAMQGPNQLQLYHNGYTNSAGLSWTTNQWYHIAVVKTGGYIKVYWNGTQVISVVDSSNFTGTYTTIGAHYSTAHLFTGYIDDLRITKGVARYTNNFAVPSKAFPDYQYSDPEWDATALLLRGEGYNGSTNIKDDTGRIITSNSLAISTTQFKYGNSSLYVNNTSANLSVSGNNIFGSNTSYTIECWVYVTAINGGDNMTLLTFNNNSYPSRWTVDFASTATQITMRIVTESNGVVFNSTAGNAALNNWHHLAYVNDAVSNTFKMYLNGVLVGSRAAVTLSTQSTIQLFKQSGAASSCNYYVDDFRIYQGYAKYQSAFTPVQQTLPSVFPTYEQYADSTVLLINGNGVNNSTNIKDETGKIITVNGNARISTAQSKFNGSSIYFDGNGDYLTLNDTSLALGTEDFTVEFWTYFNSIGGAYQDILLQNVSGGLQLFLVNQKIRYNIAYVAGILDTTTSMNINTWYHIALVRSSGIVKWYVNGVLDGSVADTTNWTSTAALGIGGSTQFFNGYLQDLRITKGLARYTANFTPPTESLKYITTQPAIPYYDYYYDNVSLLLKGEGGAGLQNNKFIDSSSNNAISTLTGTISQGSVSPYSGFGSAYYDGGTNRLSLPSSNAFDLSGGNFTIEFWMKPTAYPSVANRILMAGVNNFSNAWVVDFNTSGLLDWGRPTPGTGILSSSSVPLNKWTHIAVVCNAGSAKIYFNGILVAGPVNITLPTSGNIPLYIGYDTVGTVDGKYTGYISNLHITKSAKYTTDFIPLTTPVIADASTTLLMNFDQAAIIDSVGKQNLVSYGNVTPSFTNKKIGQSSLYFDGNGDYLTASSNEFNFGTNDFTIEAWIYPISGGTWYSIFDTRNANGGNGCVFLISSANALYIGNGVTAVGSANGVVPYNVWSHVAVSRVSGTATLYVNGVNVGSGALGTSYSLTNARIGAAFDNYYYSGYIDGLRVTKGIARYTANFIPHYLDYATTRFDSYDPHWNKTFVLLHGDTNLNDVYGKTITAVGTPTISSTQSRFGTKSISLSTANASLAVSSTSSPIIGTGDFTIELWLYPTQIGMIFDTRPDNSNGEYLTFGYGDIYFSSASRLNIANITTLAPLNTWSHHSVVRRSGVFTYFVNGVSQGSVSNTISFLAGNPVLGRNAWWNGGGDGLNTKGYINDFRISSFARYTKNFAPNLTRLPDPISNFDPYYDNVTLLLKGEGDNNSTTITDEKGHVVTANNGALISTAQYKFGTSSIYFDGVNDYVSIPNSTDFDFTNQNFSIEFWFNANTVAPTFQTLISKSTNDGGATGPWVIQLHNNNLQFLMDGTASNVTWDLFDYTSPSTITVGQWYHVALARSGTTVGCFVNGVLQNTISVGTNSVKQTSYPVLLGGIQYSGGIIQNFNGYIDDVRITKGIARYTGNFPVPVNTYPTYYPESYLAVTSPTATSVIKNGSLLFENTSGTFECWLNVSNLSGADGYSRIYNEIRHATIGGGGSIHIVNSTKKIGIYLESPDSTNFAYYSTQTITLNVWTHIVVTWATDKTLKIYINGVLDSTQTMAVNRHTGTAIIQSSIGAANNFNGTVQNLQNMRLYNTTIDETKVTTLYNNGNVLSVTPDTGLVAGYNFNSNTNNIHDVSNNGNDFVLGSGCVIQPYNI